MLSTYDERMKKVMVEKHKEREERKGEKTTKYLLWIILVIAIPLVIGFLGFPNLFEMWSEKGQRLS